MARVNELTLEAEPGELVEHVAQRAIDLLRHTPSYVRVYVLHNGTRTEAYKSDNPEHVGARHREKRAAEQKAAAAEPKMKDRLIASVLVTVQLINQPEEAGLTGLVGHIKSVVREHTDPNQFEDVGAVLVHQIRVPR